MCRWRCRGEPLMWGPPLEMSGFEQREWFSLELAGMPCAAECTLL